MGRVAVVLPRAQRGQVVACSGQIRSDAKNRISEVSSVPWTAYIIKSLSSGGYYKGSCEDISQRLHDHNAGRVKSTKSGRPWALHYNETLLSKTEALRRERFFKSRTGYRWLKDHDII